MSKMSENQGRALRSKATHATPAGSDVVTTSPPLSKRRLSKRLQEARKATGMTADQVVDRARQLGGGRWSASKITRLERNEWVRPKLEDVELLLDIYDVDPVMRAECVRLVKEARQKEWADSYSDVLGRGWLTGMEPGATRIRDVAIAVIPGLLQTQAYARAVIVGGGIVDASEIDRRVEARMLRQRILGVGAEGPKYWAVIDEAALRKVPASLREHQFQHLIDVQRPDLRIQILPDAAGLHAAISGGFTILDFEDDSSVGYSEDAATQRVHEEIEDVEAFDLVYQYVSASALGVQESLALLESLLSSPTS
ncbi:helix-turn-helix domain-containing protein [Nocardiopsis sp. NPDC101807]|uniref:helix-turn-helix domain-containing protein n=1 Tax=Nocardiopsis sp. NPDC101807 TaxID=3364339 RepID=UPI003816E32B